MSMDPEGLVNAMRTYIDAAIDARVARSVRETLALTKGGPPGAELLRLSTEVEALRNELCDLRRVLP
jgi:hypothetical protein